jgi:hypothetical protein
MARKFRPLQPRKRGGKMSMLRQCSRDSRKRQKQQKNKEHKGGGLVFLALLLGLS